MQILVTGATGYLGSRLITALPAAGHRALAANVSAAAKQADVRRVVYLGGFVPDSPADAGLSEHLASRAEVAEALTVEGGPEVVWLGAALIFVAGSTSFEMLRYVGDRFPVIPIPVWMDNPIDSISTRDVLHYLVAAADAGLVSAGAHDISGPETPETMSYRSLLKTPSRGRYRAAGPVSSMRWPIRITLPTAIRCGPVAKRCGCGSRNWWHRRSRARVSRWSMSSRGRSPARCEPASTC